MKEAKNKYGIEFTDYEPYDDPTGTTNWTPPLIWKEVGSESDDGHGADTPLAFSVMENDPARQIVAETLGVNLWRIKTVKEIPKPRPKSVLTDWCRWALAGKS